MARIASIISPSLCRVFGPGFLAGPGVGVGRTAAYTVDRATR